MQQSPNEPPMPNPLDVKALREQVEYIKAAVDVAMKDGPDQHIIEEAKGAADSLVLALDEIERLREAGRVLVERNTLYFNALAEARAGLERAWKDGATTAADAGGIGQRSFEAWSALMHKKMETYIGTVAYLTSLNPAAKGDSDG